MSDISFLKSIKIFRDILVLKEKVNYISKYIVLKTGCDIIAEVNWHLIRIEEAGD